MNIAIDAERAVLGAILLNPGTSIPEIQKHLSADSSVWFYDPKHNPVFNACVAMWNAGTPIDIITLDAELQRGPDYELIQDAGGIGYLSGLSSDVPTSASAAHYAEIVAEAHRKRRVETLMGQARTNSQNGMKYEEISDTIRRELGNLDGGRTPAYIPDDVGLMFSTEAPPMEFLFGDIVPLNTLAGCDAAGSSGKGYLAQQLSISLTIGRTIMPSFPVMKQRKVLWLQSEEPTAEIHRRMKRMARKFNLSESEQAAIADNLVVYSEISGPLNQKDENGRTVPTQLFNWLRDEVRRIQPGLIIIDPRSHYFAGEENSNTDVAAFMNLVKSLVHEVKDGATVWINHHSSKARQTDNGSEMGRGASAGRDAMRSLFNLTCLSDKEIKDAGISNPKLFVKLVLSKSNWTAPLDGAIYLRRGTGEHGGVLEEINFRDMLTAAKADGLQVFAQGFADKLSDNPESLSVKDLSKGKLGEKFRKVMKETHGVTQDAMAEIISHAENTGLITIIETGKANKIKRIPRKA